MPFLRGGWYICAPTFFLLTARRISRQPPAGRRIRFLLTPRPLARLSRHGRRPLPALQFNADYQVIVLNVLWASAGRWWRSALVALPVQAVLWIGVVMTAAHNLLDRFVPRRSDRWRRCNRAAWVSRESRLRRCSPIRRGSAYPAVGFALGQIFDWRRSGFRRRFGRPARADDRFRRGALDRRRRRSVALDRPASTGDDVVFQHDEVFAVLLFLLIRPVRAAAPVLLTAAARGAARSARSAACRSSTSSSISPSTHWPSSSAPCAMGTGCSSRRSRAFRSASACRARTAAVYAI